MSVARLSELPVQPPERTVSAPASNRVDDRGAAGAPATGASEVRDPAGRAVPSVDEARRLRAEEQAAQEHEGRQWFDRGVEAERSGKTGAARVYYQMAAYRLTGELKDRALARLAALK